MSTPNKNNFTEIVDIVLYRYNSVDSKLWSLIKRESGHRKLDQDSLLVSAEAINRIILIHFRSEVNKFQSIEGAMVYKEATTIYFMWKMLNEIKSLKWIKINLIKNANYSRVVNVDEMKTIKFSIKTIRGTFRTFDYFANSQLPLVNHILYKSKILGANQHYRVVRMSSFLSALDNFLMNNNSSEFALPVSTIINELEDFENDDPEVLIITDYDSDI